VVQKKNAFLDNLNVSKAATHAIQDEKDERICKIIVAIFSVIFLKSYIIS